MMTEDGYSVDLSPIVRAYTVILAMLVDELARKGVVDRVVLGEKLSLYPEVAPRQGYEPHPYETAVVLNFAEAMIGSSKPPPPRPVRLKVIRGGRE